MSEKEKIYKKALDKWGLKFQIIMLGEEMSELFFTISKKLRGKRVDMDIAEEIADVQIMLEQMMVAFNINPQKVENKKMAKLTKLKKQVEK